jgi:hypothetical protein
VTTYLLRGIIFTDITITLNHFVLNYARWLIRRRCSFVGNYAEIIPCRAFPNSLDMLDGHSPKQYTGPCHGMGQPEGLGDALGCHALSCCIRCKDFEI